DDYAFSRERKLENVSRLDRHLARRGSAEERRRGGALGVLIRREGAKRRLAFGELRDREGAAQGHRDRRRRRAGLLEGVDELRLVRDAARVGVGAQEEPHDHGLVLALGLDLDALLA